MISRFASGIYLLVPALLILGVWASSSVAAEEVDIEIVFAVDASGSVDLEEFNLQMSGYATALFDPEIQRVITSGPIGKVAAAVVIWSDSAFPKYSTGFHLLEDQASITNFAVRVQGISQLTDPRLKVSGGGTGIGEGIAYSIDLMQSNQFTGIRKIVDVSGDGLETAPWMIDARTMPDAKLSAALNRVQINGLPILKDHPFLDDWYQQNVIFGPGSFLVVAKSFRDFGRAIKEKMWREFRLNISQLNNERRHAHLRLQTQEESIWQ